MSAKSAFKAVLGSRIPVVPSKGGQPAYHRSSSTLATSARLIKFRGCIGDALRGKNAGSRAAVKSQFADAAKKCKMGGA